MESSAMVFGWGMWVKERNLGNNLLGYLFLWCFVILFIEFKLQNNVFTLFPL